MSTGGVRRTYDVSLERSTRHQCQARGHLL